MSKKNGNRGFNFIKSFPYINEKNKIFFLMIFISSLIFMLIAFFGIHMFRSFSSVDMNTYMKLLFTTDKGFVYSFYKTLSAKELDQTFLITMALDDYFIVLYASVFFTFFSLISISKNLPNVFKKSAKIFILLGLITAVIDIIETAMFLGFQK